MRFNFKSKISYDARQKGLQMYMNNKVELTNFIDKQNNNNYFYFEGNSYGNDKYVTKITVDLNSGAIISHNCSCPRATTDEKPCKHIFAFHLLVNNLISKKYIDKNTKLSFDDVISTKAVIPRRKEFSVISSVTESPQKNDFIDLLEDLDKLKEKLNVEVIIVKNEDGDFDNFLLHVTSINADYIIKEQKINDFINAVIKKVKFYFGKKLTYKSDFFYFSAFELELINLIYSGINKNLSSSIITKDIIYLLKDFNSKIFYIIDYSDSQNNFQINNLSNSFSIKELKKIDDFTLEKINENEFRLSHSLNNLFLPFGKNNIDFIQSDTKSFYYINSNIRQSFRKFLLFFDNNNKVTINHSQLILLKQVINDFKDSLGLEIIGDISFEHNENVQIIPSFYLTVNNSLFKTKHMICDIDFKYNDDKLQKDFHKENEIIEYVKSNGFFTFDRKLMFNLGETPQENIYKIYTLLRDKGEIYLNKRSLKVKNVSNYSLNVERNKNNLLEVNFSVEGMDRKSFQKFMNSSEDFFFDGEILHYLDKSSKDAEKLKQISDYFQIFEDKNKIIMNENQYAIGEEIFDLSYKIKDNFFRKFDTLKDKNFKLSNSLKHVLRDYQKDGFKWLSSLEYLKVGGILADDMGLGKTLQAISYIDSNKNKGKFLIIAPSSLIYNWKSEIEKFGLDMNTLILNEESENRERVMKNSKYNVIITSYGILSRDIDIISKINFHTVFLDEAQKIKNPNSLAHKAARQINTKNKFCLTGTPIENNLIELWSLFDFIMPGYLFSLDKFKNRFVNNSDNNELLNHLVKPFILRRTKKELLTELPDKIYEDIYVPLYENEKKLYKSAIENIDLFNDDNNKIKILALLTRLKQICCHPKLIDETYKNNSSKLDLFNDVIQNAISSGHRILVFSQFTSMLNILADNLKKNKINYFMLTGSTHNKERLKMANDFNNGEKEVFLISLKAGGTGLNLTGADIVIHFDQWWNPAVEEQATDRAYRIGQDKNVQVIRLISKGTIEEKIQQLHQNKKELIEQIISSNEKSILSLTNEELKGLIKLDELI
mgnify:CR=1 FL=1